MHGDLSDQPSPDFRQSCLLLDGVHEGALTCLFLQVLEFSSQRQSCLLLDGVREGALICLFLQVDRAVAENIADA